jgi:ankyrin repeat protein
VQAGNTALHKAAAGGHVDVVVELLRAGSDPYTANQVAHRWRCFLPAASCLASASHDWNMALQMQSVAASPDDRLTTAH